MKVIIHGKYVYLHNENFLIAEGVMIQEHKFLKMHDGIELHARIQETGSPVWLIKTHGIGEHLERHNYIPELFGKDFNIFQYDLRGHGRSMGEAGYISDFNVYMEDLEEIVTFLKEHYKMQRYVMIAHSMGALINCGYLKTFASEDFYPERVFFNAPPVGFPGALGQLIRMSPLPVFKNLSKLPYSLKLGGLVDLDYLSHDPHIKEDYLSDELNHKKLHSKLVLQMVKASQEIFSSAINPKCPAFISVGSEDKVVHEQSLIDYFNLIEKDFDLKIFDGAYHEIHNEIEKYRKPYFTHMKNSIMECFYSPQEEDQDRVH